MISDQRLSPHSWRRPSAAMAVTREGYVTKQGHVRKNWKRRFFSLTPYSLTYYKAAGGRAKGVWPLREAVLHVNDTVPGRPYVFELVLPSNRQLRCQCSSGPEREAWLSSIQHNIDLIRQKQNAMTSKIIDSSLKCMSKKRTRLNVFTSTWNMGEKPLLSLAEARAWIPSGFDLYAIAVQECINTDSVKKTLHTRLGEEFVLIDHSIGNSATALGYHGFIYLAIFVRTILISEGLCLCASAERKSISLGRNLLFTRATNKGAVSITLPMMFPDREGNLRIASSMTFVSCHLASDRKGQSKLSARNSDAQAMIENFHLSFPTQTNTVPKSALTRTPRRRRGSMFQNENITSPSKQARHRVSYTDENDSDTIRQSTTVVTSRKPYGEHSAVYIPPNPWSNVFMPKILRIVDKLIQHPQPVPTYALHPNGLPRNRSSMVEVVRLNDSKTVTGSRPTMESPIQTSKPRSNTLVMTHHPFNTSNIQNKTDMDAIHSNSNQIGYRFAFEPPASQPQYKNQTGHGRMGRQRFLSMSDISLDPVSTPSMSHKNTMRQFTDTRVQRLLSIHEEGTTNSTQKEIKSTESADMNSIVNLPMNRVSKGIGMDEQSEGLNDHRFRKSSIRLSSTFGRSFAAADNDLSDSLLNAVDEAVASALMATSKPSTSATSQQQSTLPCHLQRALLISELSFSVSHAAVALAVLNAGNVSAARVCGTGNDLASVLPNLNRHSAQVGTTMKLSNITTDQNKCAAISMRARRSRSFGDVADLLRYSGNRRSLLLSNTDELQSASESENYPTDTSTTTPIIDVVDNKKRRGPFRRFLKRFQRPTHNQRDSRGHDQHSHAHDQHSPTHTPTKIKMRESSVQNMRMNNATHPTSTSQNTSNSIQKSNTIHPTSTLLSPSTLKHKGVTETVSSSSKQSNQIPTETTSGYVFLMGDMNYRVQMPPEQAVHLIASAEQKTSVHTSISKERSTSVLDLLDETFRQTNSLDHTCEQFWRRLLTLDELRNEINHSSLFLGFEEAAIAFPPTYRRHRSTETWLRRAHGDYANLDKLQRGYTIDKLLNRFEKQPEDKEQTHTDPDDQRQEIDMYQTTANHTSTANETHTTIQNSPSKSVLTEKQANETTKIPDKPIYNQTTNNQQNTNTNEQQTTNNHEQTPKPTLQTQHSIAQDNKSIRDLSNTTRMPGRRELLRRRSSSIAVSSSTYNHRENHTNSNEREKPVYDPIHRVNQTHSDQPKSRVARTPSYTDRILVRRPLEQQPLLVSAQVCDHHWMKQTPSRQTRTVSNSGVSSPALSKLTQPRIDRQVSFDASGSVLNTKTVANANTKTVEPNGNTKTVKPNVSSVAETVTELPSLYCRAYTCNDEVVGSDHVPVIGVFSLHLDELHNGPSQDTQTGGVLGVGGTVADSIVQTLLTTARGLMPKPYSTPAELKSLLMKCGLNDLERPGRLGTTAEPHSTTCTDTPGDLSVSADTLHDLPVSTDARYDLAASTDDPGDLPVNTDTPHEPPVTFSANEMHDTETVSIQNSTSTCNNSLTSSTTKNSESAQSNNHTLAQSENTVSNTSHGAVSTRVQKSSSNVVSSHQNSTETQNDMGSMEHTDELTVAPCFLLQSLYETLEPSQLDAPRMSRLIDALKHQAHETTQSSSTGLDIGVDIGVDTGLDTREIELLKTASLAFLENNHIASRLVRSTVLDKTLYENALHTPQREPFANITQSKDNMNVASQTQRETTVLTQKALFSSLFTALYQAEVSAAEEITESPSGRSSFSAESQNLSDVSLLESSKEEPFHSCDIFAPGAFDKTVDEWFEEYTDVNEHMDVENVDTLPTMHPTPRYHATLTPSSNSKENRLRKIKNPQRLIESHSHTKSNVSLPASRPVQTVKSVSRRSGRIQALIDQWQGRSQHK